MGKKATYIFLSVILIAAALLRFWEISAFSFSNDELSALVRLRYESFWEMIQGGVLVDGHPAGVQSFLYFWTSLTGLSELGVRLPFIIGGIAGVFLIYVTGREWFGQNTAFFAAAVMAVSEYPLLYSRLARPYVSGLFLVLAFLWIWGRFIRGGRYLQGTVKWFYTLGFALVLGLCMYNHYFSFLTAALIALAGLFWVPKKYLPFYIGGGVLGILMFLPHLQITLVQLGYGGVGTWLGRPGLVFPFQHWQTIFNHSSLFSLLFLLLAMIALFMPRKINWTIHPRLLLLLWILPLLTGFIYSYLIDPVLQDSVLIFSYPLLLLAIGAPLSALGRKSGFWLAVAVFLILGVHTLLGRGFYRTYHFGDFKDAAKTVDSFMKHRSIWEYTFVLNANNRWYYDFYAEHKPDFLMEDIRNMDSLRMLRQWLEKSTKPGLVYISLKGEPPETFDLLRDAYPCLEEFRDHQSKSWVAILNRQYDDCTDAPVEPWFLTDSLIFGEAGNLPQDTARQDSTASYDGLFMDASMEFSPSLEYYGNELDAYPDLVYASADMKWHNDAGNPQLVVVIVDKQGNPRLWRSSSAKVFMDAGETGRIHIHAPVRFSMRSKDKLSVYLYNYNGSEVTLYDLKMSLK